MTIRHTNGFTLIELVITILLLAIGATVVFNSFGTLLTNAHRSSELLQGDYLATEWASLVEAAHYGKVDSLAATENTISGFPGFARSRSAPSPATVAGCTTCEQSVTITVTYNGSLVAQKTATAGPLY